MQRCWDRHRVQRRVEVEAVLFLSQQTGIQNGSGGLFDEEWDTVGPCRDLVKELIGKRLSTRNTGCDGGDLLPAKTIEGKPSDDRMPAKAMLETRPGSREHHDTRLLDPVECFLDQLQRRRVDPVEVLNHEQHRRT
jgi:hypothetical protein